ncbi:Glyoxylase, beta-lactamase superfamily II [Micromonospora rhizosphaerae]|uniref:Glyoxylase, beta-lactamase superfamily II n=1 Tax=Micromonospora rhizosphaerae TaxID=568872 RepID=A0A1C6TEM7_9ACTN|nr:MBL fold metallo-hydrolase [Micromonospora rhizosphaerae]SCL39943.1 Glyoxylase, beta-lactamase superfamily II [Micromonospora rhizosphaerae]
MALSRTLGSITVTPLTDGEGAFFQPREEAFPAATAEQWREADRRDPAAVTADGQWWLPFRSFALRDGDGPVMLVDAGIGPAGSPAASWAPVPGRLPAELAAAGIDPTDVRTVVLTHLHSDHIGWAITGTPGRPYFPNATYVLQRAELDAMETINPRLPAGLVAPLRAAGQLRVVDGAAAITPQVRLVPTPGHTVGHQSVLLEAAGERLLLTGDLLVHTVQLVNPELAYAHEEDPATARASRVALLRGPATLATPHLGDPFVALAPTPSPVDHEVVVTTRRSG